MSYFTHTVVQCTHQVYGVNLKKQSLKSFNVAHDNSFRITHTLPSCCSASFMFVSNHIKCIRSFIGRSHTMGPAAKVGPCPFAVVYNGTAICSLLVLSNMPEGTNKQYQNTSNAISKL